MLRPKTARPPTIDQSRSPSAWPCHGDGANGIVVGSRAYPRARVRPLTVHSSFSGFTFTRTRPSGISSQKTPSAPGRTVTTGLL